MKENSLFNLISFFFFTKQMVIIIRFDDLRPGVVVMYIHLTVLMCRYWFVHHSAKFRIWMVALPQLRTLQNFCMTASLGFLYLLNFDSYTSNIYPTRNSFYRWFGKECFCLTFTCIFCIQLTIICLLFVLLLFFCNFSHKHFFYSAAYNLLLLPYKLNNKERADSFFDSTKKMYKT